MSSPRNYGIETDPQKVKCIQNWPTLVNNREFQQLIGMASYYRKFMKNFAKRAAPLHSLAEGANHDHGLVNMSKPLTFLSTAISPHPS